MGFEVLFEKGRKFQNATVEPRDAGKVTIQSGSIAVCDPSDKLRDAALAREVPNGSFPVVVSRAEMHRNGVHAIAAAMVRFSDAPIASWEPALPKGEDPVPLEPGEFFGYGVDAATGCFVDGEVAKKLSFDLFEQKIMPAFAAIGPQDGYGEFPIEGGTFVAFNTGAGDGMYASFWGLDTEGRVAALCTEFRIAGTEETKGGELIAKHWPGTPPPPPSLSPLLEVGRTFKGGEITRIDDVGTLDLPSGVLLAGAARAPSDDADAEETESEEPEEAYDPTSRHVVIEGLPKGSFPVRLSVSDQKRGKRIVSVPCAFQIVFAPGTVTTWSTAVPSNCGRGVSLAINASREDALGLYDGSLKSAIDADSNQSAMMNELGSDDLWKASAFPVTPDGGAPLSCVGIFGEAEPNYVFFGHAADGAILTVVIPLSMLGKDVTRHLVLASDTRRNLEKNGAERSSTSASAGEREGAETPRLGNDEERGDG